MNPKTGSGALAIFLLGLGGAVTALLVAQFFPSIIPARATSVKL
jgi:hypothetical protein